jgi:hypothetical protein
MATDVTAALEAATRGAETPPTSTETDTPAAGSVKETAAKPVTPAAPVESQTPSTEEGKTKPGPIPYDRFSEVNQAKNDLTAKVEELTGKLSAAVEREDSLRTRLGTAEQEATILQSIRDLAEEDPEWRPTLEKLDKRIRNVKEEVEAGTKTEEEGKKETTKLLDDAKKELAEEFENQQTDFIVMQARQLADSYLRNLPKEYTEAERAVIGEMLTPRVDWDSVAKTPVDLPKHIASGLEKTLKDYGEPRGALTAKLAEIEDNKTETEPVETPEKIAERLANTDWSETVQSEDGKPSPKHSDEDFARALAQQVRILRG